MKVLTNALTIPLLEYYVWREKMSYDPLLKKTDDPGYIVAWKYKYEFKVGKYTGEVMTYGEAKVRAEKLNIEQPDMTFWPEKVQESTRAPTRFYNPEAH
jgi:hypothetical protein